MHKVKLSSDLQLSPIIHGHWRLREWNMNAQEILAFTEKSVELGVTSIDHADIYGDYRCEKLFGQALGLKPSLRKEIQIVTKCGIKLVSEKYPERKLKTYDYSFRHIISSVDNSLQNFGTDYLDLLLLHRPSPFFDPQEVARAFAHLRESGKVINFGVSNFNPLQYEMLNEHLEERLVTNQVEISPLCLEHFKNGNMDFFMKNKIRPLAWSPLAGGEIMNKVGDKGARLGKALNKVAHEIGIESIDKVIYAWLLKHPAGIMPIVGSGKFERLKHAVDALNINMSLEQWFEIYNASEGHELP